MCGRLVLEVAMLFCLFLFLFLSRSHLTVVFQQRTAAGDVGDVHHDHGERPQTRKRAHNGSQERRRCPRTVDLRSRRFPRYVCGRVIEKYERERLSL